MRTAVKGPSGEPTQLLETVARLSATVARPGGVFMLTIQHDDGCPCLVGSGTSACTCETANVSIREGIQP